MVDEYSMNVKVNTKTEPTMKSEAMMKGRWACCVFDWRALRRGSPLRFDWSVPPAYTLKEVEWPFKAHVGHTVGGGCDVAVDGGCRVVVDAGCDVKQ